MPKRTKEAILQDFEFHKSELLRNQDFSTMKMSLAQYRKINEYHLHGILQCFAEFYNINLEDIKYEK